MDVVIAIAILGGLGLIFGLVLAAASKVFYVETDPRLDQLNECLPGANCGGCGFAGCGGYDVTVFQLVIIMVLALIASMGTPAAPGAGAVILFTILSGMGFTGEQALIAYSLILAINRPIEMLVTSLNVTGDALTSIAVAKSEGKLNLDVFNKQ